MCELTWGTSISNHWHVQKLKHETCYWNIHQNFNVNTTMQQGWTHLSTKSVRNMYPWHVLKSSSKTWDLSLESLRKQNTVKHISTISSGERSWLHCMLSTHSPKQFLSVTESARDKRSLKVEEKYSSLNTIQMVLGWKTDKLMGKMILWTCNNIKHFMSSENIEIVFLVWLVFHKLYTKVVWSLPKLSVPRIGR